MYKHKAYSIYLEESKCDSHTKAWEGPILPKKLPCILAAVHSIIYKLYEQLVLTKTKIPSRLQTWPFMRRSAPQLDSAHRRRLRKKYVNRCSICKPVNCIRHSSTPTNDKKADGHDWRHRYMSGDSWPPHQSPLLCKAKSQGELMEEPEERTAARRVS